jgi:ParB family chromosome partitioning protein
MNAKKRALGKGLSALLQDSGSDALSQGNAGQFSIGNIAEIHLDQIEANPFQPRDHFEEASLEELAESIRQQGIIQPVTVRKTDHDSYQLISGERRLKAARMAGLESIPAFIRTADDNQMLELALVENIQRENLNAIEIGISYQRLIEECQVTQEELSQRIGKSRATVANYIRLLKLPPELQIAIRDNRISMGHARALINIDDQETQLAILKNILLKDLSVRDVEAIVRNLNKEKNDKPAPLQAIPASHKQAVKELSTILGMNVQLRRTADGKGTLSIRFSSDKEFERLREILNA